MTAASPFRLYNIIITARVRRRPPGPRYMNEPLPQYRTAAINRILHPHTRARRSLSPGLRTDVAHQSNPGAHGDRATTTPRRAVIVLFRESRTGRARRAEKPNEN